MARSDSRASSAAMCNQALMLYIDDFDETVGGPFEWDLKRLI
jgi:uncharacterized protein (DUF2252 family)